MASDLEKAREKLLQDMADMVFSHLLNHTPPRMMFDVFDPDLDKLRWEIMRTLEKSYQVASQRDKIARLYDKGMSLRMIAKTCGISTERARQLVDIIVASRKSEARQMKEMTLPFQERSVDLSTLSTRAKAVLRKLNVEKVADILNLSRSTLLVQRNVGIKTVREIESFIGKPLIDKG